MKFRNSFINSVMASAAGHAVIGAAMMGIASTSEAPESTSPRIDSNLAETMEKNRKLSNALTEEFFSSRGFGVDMTSSRFLQMGGPSEALPGQVELCKRLPDACFRNVNSYTPAIIPTQLMDRLVQESVMINKLVAPTDDDVLYGEVDYWNYPDGGQGDCEDYVLAKMRRFHETFGIPLNNMAIVFVHSTPGQRDVGGHAILALRTTEGDYLFDNLTDDVRFPYETKYKFVSATSFETFTDWRDLGGVEFNLASAKEGRLSNPNAQLSNNIEPLGGIGALLHDPKPLNTPVPTFKPKL